ncbi:MFS transporter [Winogradskya consettensis]|uniref:MFS transporter n=1 Tax=Winogradskya consettensis TaxID=113560 RepID=A0A919SFC5_9ACTN|nr:MFS transporter [Actinoplanes consettensis]GIM69678.1 MFS transporter [Actinoplanes consettensis]
MPVTERVSYATLLSSPARRWLLLTGAISRLPLAGAGVAIVLAVGNSTGSYGVGGTASALYVVGASVMAPVHGRRMDRLGQRRELMIGAGVQVCALIALMVACARPFGWQVPTVLAASLLAGMAQIDIGSAVRARWAYAVTQPGARQTAFFLESVVDEMMFVLAPVAITAITIGHPWASPVVVLAGPALGWFLLAAQTATEPPAMARRASPGGVPGSRSAVRTKAVVAAFVGIGAYLGSIEILLVALADGAGHPAWAGISLAAWAIGSASAALFAGPRLGQIAPQRLFVPAMAWMTGCGLLLPLARSPVLLAVACLLAGVGAAPALSAGFSLLSNPETGAAEGMTWASAGMGAGTTIGAFCGGWLVDRVASHNAFWLSVLFGLGALLLAWRTRRPTLPTH